jgi:hypothetical protein
MPVGMATEIFEMAEEEGISRGTLRRATQAMQIRRWRTGMGGKFIWSLHEEEGPKG